LQIVVPGYFVPLAGHHAVNRAKANSLISLHPVMVPTRSRNSGLFRRKWIAVETAEPLGTDSGIADALAPQGVGARSEQRPDAAEVVEQSLGEGFRVDAGNVSASRYSTSS